MKDKTSNKDNQYSFSLVAVKGKGQEASRSITSKDQGQEQEGPVRGSRENQYQSQGKAETNKEGPDKAKSKIETVTRTE